MIWPVCRGSRVLFSRFAFRETWRPLSRPIATQCPILRKLHTATTPEQSHNDHILREIFDSQSKWRDFSSDSKLPTTNPGKGLFQNQYLTEPQGFLRFAQDARKQCQKVVDAVLSASTREEYKALPRHLDLLSDLLCRVLDISDFVRATHPDRRFQEAATQAYAFLWEYMNVLNTTPGLNDQLRKAISRVETRSDWSEEELTVSKILLKDFSNSAVTLPQREREQFVKYSNDLKILGQGFQEEMRPVEPWVEFDSRQLKGLDPTIIARHKINRNKIFLPTAGDDAYLALGMVQDENVRRKIYIANRQAPAEQIARLEALLETRASIAKLSDFKSYAEMSLADKMAESPEAVNSFLMALSADNAAHVQRELGLLQTEKNLSTQTSSVNAWDVLYYRRLAASRTRSGNKKSDFMEAYFSLGTVMQGLSRLFSRLYGISFVARQTSPGETWTSEVRRLDVLHETEGHVAVLYCDLFERVGKAPNPAHFTLRCSRKIQDIGPGQTEEDLDYESDGMATTRSITGETYQLPTIALICDFPQSPIATTPTLLSFRDVQTLFHEMGHAIHSILGRTSLQVVSGTRCPTDFAELPSVLMEYFAADSSVLSLFARHWETDEPLPYELVTEALESQKRWQGLQTETQILYSLLDQAYHSLAAQGNLRSLDSTKIFFEVYDRNGSISEPRETNPQAFFGHLVEYGGTYYSYLFDRAIAGKVWKEVFRSGENGGGIDRDAGERFKNEVLKWGGSRSGWACVSGVLGDESLKDGGKDAMKKVGQWGVHA